VVATAATGIDEEEKKAERRGHDLPAKSSVEASGDRERPERGNPQVHADPGDSHLADSG